VIVGDQGIIFSDLTAQTTAEPFDVGRMFSLPTLFRTGHELIDPGPCFAGFMSRRCGRFWLSPICTLRPTEAGIPRRRASECRQRRRTAGRDVRMGTIRGGPTSGLTPGRANCDAWTGVDSGDAGTTRVSGAPRRLQFPRGIPSRTRALQRFRCGAWRTSTPPRRADIRSLGVTEESRSANSGSSERRMARSARVLDRGPAIERRCLLRSSTVVDFVLSATRRRHRMSDTSIFRWVDVS
jgi:hypothetical protein